MADGYQGFDSSQWARLIHTTLADHITEIEDAFMRNFVMLAQLQAGGRVSYNNAGNGFDWPVRYRNHNVEGNTGETQRNFARRNLLKHGRLGYRGYQVTDALYRKEFLQNRGKSAIVNTFNTFIESLTTSIEQEVGTHPYIDGSLAANAKFWEGLETMFETNGTVTTGTGAQRSTNAADEVAYPSDTYASLSTELGNYGGENESGVSWPNGLADPEFDFWSPVIVVADSTNASFPSSTNTWAGQGDEVMRFGLIECQRNSGRSNQIDTVVLSRDFYRGFLNLIDDKEEIQITPGAPNNLKQLGFTDVVGFDGKQVTWETGVPTSTGYGYSTQNIEMKCMDSTMWYPEGPEYDIHTQAWEAVVSTLSNFKFKSPRNFVKFANSADIT